MAAGSSNARLPFITATASTPLIVLGAARGPQSSAVPLWVGIPATGIFSLIVLWAAAILLQQRQQAEMQLRHAKDELEARVDARTKRTG